MMAEQPESQVQKQTQQVDVKTKKMILKNMFDTFNEKLRKKLMTGMCIVHTTDDFCIFSLCLFVCLFV